jgi:hypothetical protein
MKIVFEGFTQAMDGENLLVNTVTDEPVKIMVKDKKKRWELYCKKVRVTIEEMPDVQNEQN